MFVSLLWTFLFAYPTHQQQSNAKSGQCESRLTAAYVRTCVRLEEPRQEVERHSPRRDLFAERLCLTKLEEVVLRVPTPRRARNVCTSTSHLQRTLGLLEFVVGFLVALCVSSVVLDLGLPVIGLGLLAHEVENVEDDRRADDAAVRSFLL